MKVPRSVASRLGLVACLLACGCATSAPKKPAAAAAEVAVVEVQPRDEAVAGEWVGTLDGKVNARIKAQVSGYLLRQVYQEGAAVRKGQLLFELDPRPFEAAVAQARGQLAQARGQLGQATSQRQSALAGLAQARSQMLQARANLTQSAGLVEQAAANLAQAQAHQSKTQQDEERLTPLAQVKAVPQQDLDNALIANQAARAQVRAAAGLLINAKGQLEAANAQIDAARSSEQAAQAQLGNAEAAIVSAQAQIQSAQAQVEQAELQLGFSRIYAPIDGVAGIARAQVGDLVGPQAEPLTEISSIDPIRVNFNMSESEYLESVKRSPAASRREEVLRGMQFELVQSDGSVYPRKGSFLAEDRELASATGALKLSLVFPNPQRTLKPGQFARIRATRYTERNALLVPQRAVIEMQERQQLALVGDDGKVVMQPVVLGERVGSDWIVKEGLRAGQRVIVEGTQKAMPGAPVKTHPYEGGAK